MIVLKAVEEEISDRPGLTNDFRKILDTLPEFVWSASPEGAIKYFSKKGLEYTGFSMEEIKGWNWMDSGLLHPDEIQSIIKQWSDIIKSGKEGEIQGRMRRYDGVYLWFLFRVAPLYNDFGMVIAWWGVDIEIDKIKRTEDKLRKSEAYLAEAHQLTMTGSFSINVLTNELICSKETLSIVGFENRKNITIEEVLTRIHPDDRQVVKEMLDCSIKEGSYLEHEHRLLMPDGSIKFIHLVAHILKFESASPELVGAISDITRIKLAEEIIREKEKAFRQIVETVPCLIIVMAPDGEYLYANKKLLDYTGCKQEDVTSRYFHEHIYHQADMENWFSKKKQALVAGKPFELERRLLGKDGRYRWFLTRFNPLKNNNGKIIQWYTSAIDINDRKQKEEKIHNENIVLKEVIDKASDTDIVGKSKQMQNVNHLISLVSLTNSSVLILGETGTGKELVARAIHNSSNRKNKIMIKVNCASLPVNLIESELFGHEKGSFTGAIERRIGKFELADNSTLFLDEIGEMPLDLQVKLLRAIQEKEFERVGGKETIKIDVRIIAASNRNLQNEVKDGKFRIDLYYRLNVFPIVIPPLRERKDDIPILANHFLAKSSKNIGKKINNISKNVIEELINYDWPGNVRELEHLIERSVILNNDIIDEIHLPKIESKSETGSVKTIHDNERDHILQVLKKCKGKKGGTDGAAVLLGIPVSTLNSKIKRLGITKGQIYSS